MRNKIYILGIFFLLGCSPIHKLYNNFSEFKEVKNFSDSNIPLRIYFDRFGDIYPSHPIGTQEFDNEQSTLEFYFKNNKAELKKAFDSEGLSYSEGDNVKVNFEKLQDNLRANYVSEINRSSKSKKLVFLIHGFNNTGESASAALENLRVEIVKKFPQHKFRFVEVYWDGLTKRTNSLNTAVIWNNAQYSAAMAGLSLRRILSGIANDESYVLTHSLGAAVITEALFNVRRFDNDYYDTHRDGIEIKTLQTAYDTPTTKFSVGMLTPAIPGKNVFNEYYQRTVAGRTTGDTTANYRFVNGFNKYDIATTKGVFSRYFGSTTLSCDEDAHREVEEIFRNNSTIYSRINFSADKKNKQRSHAVAKYIKNSSFDSFLVSVIN